MRNLMCPICGANAIAFSDNPVPLVVANDYEDAMGIYDCKVISYRCESDHVFYVSADDI